MRKPVAYQWLNTAHFRKKIPKHSNPAEWNALCHISSSDNVLTDDEIADIDMMPSNPEGQDIIDFARAVIAAYEAKRNGDTK